MSWSPFSVLKFKRVHHDYISISPAKVYFQGVFLSNTQKVILIYYWSTVAALGFSSGRASCILMRFPIKLFSYCAYQTIMTICAKCNVIGTQFVHNILTLVISGGSGPKAKRCYFTWIIHESYRILRLKWSWRGLLNGFSFRSLSKCIERRVNISSIRRRKNELDSIMKSKELSLQLAINLEFYQFVCNYNNNDGKNFLKQ